MLDYIPFLLILMVLAAFLQQNSIMPVFYLLAGVYLTSLWWSRTAISKIQVARTFTDRAFLDQDVPVEIQVTNAGLLPAVWLHLHESLPVELISPNFYSQVITLGPRASHQLKYVLHANKRGYYALGPLFLTAGDLLGVTRPQERSAACGYLTVYPKIVALPELRLPSQSPFGTLRHSDPIFEDPSRPRGKRDYQVGDSLHRVDWKATARAGRLQTRLFEPSIAITTQVYLDLHLDHYDFRTRQVMSELAVTAAASLASWAASKKQAFGLTSNGLDPLQPAKSSPAPLPPRKGAAHLMNVLAVLARLQAGDCPSFAALLASAVHTHPWGTTLVLISGSYDPDLTDSLFQARRRGLAVVIVEVGPAAQAARTRQMLRPFGIAYHNVRSEFDLEAWQA
jgi:uncharacterized protein (DUF58 family)